jgi:hypothetical protein
MLEVQAMDVSSIVRSIDQDTARALVMAARRVIDALLIEGERIRQTQTPAPHDYNAAGLPRATAGGGWLSHEELRDTARRMAEAIAAEKWTDGLITALKLLGALGVML